MFLLIDDFLIIQLYILKKNVDILLFRIILSFTCKIVKKNIMNPSHKMNLIRILNLKDVY